MCAREAETPMHPNAATMILLQEDKMQRTHTMKDNLLFLFRKSFSFDKSLFVSVIARIPVNILIPLITSYLTKYIGVRCPAGGAGAGGSGLRGAFRHHESGDFPL